MAVLKAAIERLISAYRKDDWADPKAFVVQLGAVLEDYPIAIVEQVTNPKTGIQRTCKFPPSIAEVVAACEDAMKGKRERQEAAHAWARQEEATRLQIEQRRAFYENPTPAEKAHVQASLDQYMQGKRRSSARNLTTDERREAQAVLDRYAADAHPSTSAQGQSTSEAAE